MDPDELTLSPTLIVDCSEPISCPFDPNNFYHLENPEASNNLIENVLKIEDEQTGNAEMKDELSGEVVWLVIITV